MKRWALADLYKLPGYIYLASPYTRYAGGIDAASRDVCVVAAALMKRGLRVYSPIAHSHAIAAASGIDPLDQSFWIDADAPFVDLASALIVAQLPGWDDSFGVSHEIAQFKAASKPVVFVKPESL